MPKRTLFEISFRHLKPIFRIYFSTFIFGGGGGVSKKSESEVLQVCLTTGGLRRA